MATVIEIADELLRLSARLDDATSHLSSCASNKALAEHAYKVARASAYIEAERGTVAEKESKTTMKVKTELKTSLRAEAACMAALELVRSLRAQLSALQSVANATRVEAELARTGPGA